MYAYTKYETLIEGQCLLSLLCARDENTEMVRQGFCPQRTPA